MRAPQIIMIAIYAVSVGISIAKHGEPKTGEYHGPGAFIGAAIGIAILWWGGFFR